jgi:pyruvate/2-oxoglutarate dehydrogenase complex dihydrolipoamide dehydrogenase (E3) component
MCWHPRPDLPLVTEPRLLNSESSFDRWEGFVKTEFDVIVIGMGVAGEGVAGTVADGGLEVLAIEKKLVGGECPYWGCVPSKMMLRAAETIGEARRVDKLAGSATVSPDWNPVAKRVREEATGDWNDKVAIERHEEKGSTVLKTEARITGSRTVEADGTAYTARKGIVIATGGIPAVPPIDGIKDVDYWTNRDAIEAKEVPASLVVLGGGPIGAELAQVFNRFGADVTVVEMAEQLVPLDEPENGRALAEAFEADGIKVRLGVSADAVSRTSEGIEVRLSDGSTVTAEKLLVATGRRVDLSTLGIDSIGLDPKARDLPVDEHMRVTDGVWAVGDVTGKGAFTHVGVYQSRVAAADILGKEHKHADYLAVPRVTFTDPEVASVGLTEKQAREEGRNVKVGVAKTGSSARGWMHGPGAEYGVTKVIVDTDAGTLIGASTMGPAAGEVLGFLVLAVKTETPVSTLKDVIYPYPTFMRGIEDALNDLDS